jgi:hypothetical protein
MTVDAEWWLYLVWVLAAAGLGFLVTAILAGKLRLPRPWLLVPYLIVVGAFLYGFFRWSGIDLVSEARQHWVLGLAAGILAGAFLIRNVLSQPASPRSEGPRLVFDLLWLGVVYGTLDALLLSVMPVVATWQAFSLLGWTAGWPGRVAVGLLALVASLFVTVAYHLGYPEFRGPQVVGPAIGNGVSSLAYLLSTNPIAAVFSHVAMHVAAVLQGPETTAQLPPHY